MYHSPDEIAYTLAHEYGFVPLPETMYELWEDIDPEACPEGHLVEDLKVLRIANTNFPSRMHFLFDIDQFEWYLLSTGKDE